ncbi:FlgN protein [Roseovarius litorisediminis]|uniref:FlgN protein n=1 Tax=Roseovarius litorisediminis TaxID=1312363 RepID=A0A1Y5SNR5_9RHOB|nr:flagellar export chaperone FlgN [Roseovarius litorisediminis]SLN44863.1 FlgN protein [Roseovarius litorisediminis]
MTHESDQKIIDRLEELLDTERSALLQGDLEKIAGLVEEKESLIDALNVLDAGPRQKLEALQKKVMRNQALLDGALQGIRTVAARMAAFRRIRRSLETYDESGQKQIIQGEIERKVEKRA